MISEILDVIENKIIDKIEDINGLVVYEAWKNLMANGVPPLTLTKCKGVDLIDYKLYGNSVQGKLPSEYQEVEYIEATGSQYIDTGFTPTGKLTVEGKVYVSKPSRTINVAGTVSFGWALSFNETIYSYLDTMGSILIQTNSMWDTNLEFTAINDKDKYFRSLKINVDDQYVEEQRSNDVYRQNLLLFSYRYTNPFIGKCYNIKFYDNDILVRDFIPCYRISDNVVGMYDLVENKFYANVGTGSFLKGNAVTTPDTPIEVESVGYKTINLLNPATVKDSNKYISYTTGNEATPGATGGKWRSSDFMPVLGDTSYHFLANNSNASVAGMAWYDENQNIISGTTTTTINKNNGNMTSPSDAKYARVSWRIDEGYNPDWQNTVQFAEGTDLTVFEPYGYKIPVKASGKNLALNDSPKNPDLNYTSSGGGTTVINYSEEDGGYYTTNHRTRSFGVLEPGTYVLSCYVKRRSEGGSRYAILTKTNDGGTIGPIMPSNLTDDYKRFSYKFTITESRDFFITIYDTLYFKDIQLEKSEVLTEYEPYVEPITTNIYLNEPLRKIDKYVDYIDFEKKKVVRNINKQIYSGSENWGLSGVFNNANVFFLNNAVQYTPANPLSVISNCFTSRAKIDDADWKVGEVRFQSQSNNATKRIYLSHEATSLDELKVFLETKYNEGVPVYILYPMNQHIEETIELPNIPTIKGTTVIEVDTIIQPSNLEVVYKGK